MCEECFHKMEPKFVEFKIDDIHALAIYEYNEEIKKLIYTYKGCYDYELKDVFLDRYKNYLKLIYHGYVVVPVPSSKSDDTKRGFNHVDEIAKTLALPIHYVLEKIRNIKQSSLSFRDRLNSKSNLAIKNGKLIANKKVLIIDDVYTSGATVRHAIELVKSVGAKKLKVLVVSKTIDLQKRGKQEY